MDDDARLKRLEARAAVLKALAHPTRLLIVEEFVGVPENVAGASFPLTTSFRGPPPTFSRMPINCPRTRTSWSVTRTSTVKARASEVTTIRPMIMK